MLRNKKIILPFLFLAWTIIFAHSIIPHHHHSENILSECNNYNLHNNTSNVNLEIYDCDLDYNHFTCHFQVKVLTQTSIDHIFIDNSESTYFDYFLFEVTNNIVNHFHSVSDQIPKTKFLRGPPQGFFS